MENTLPNFQPVSSPSKNPYKILFFISLGLFLVVSSVSTTLLLTQNKSASLTTSNTSQTVSTTVTKITPTISQTTPTTTESEIPSDWETYTDSTYNFSISYPSDWTLSKTAEGFSLASAEMNKRIETEGSTPVNGPEINVLIYDSFSKLPEYTIGQVSSKNTKTLKEYVNGWLSDVKEITTNEINGYSGYTGYPTHYIYLQKGNIIIHIVEKETLTDSEYETSQFKEIIDTFRFN